MSESYLVLPKLVQLFMSGSNKFQTFVRPIKRLQWRQISCPNLNAGAFVFFLPPYYNQSLEPYNVAAEDMGMTGTTHSFEQQLKTKIEK